jgi:PAS domain S-box-containing protein
MQGTNRRDSKSSSSFGGELEFRRFLDHLPAAAYTCDAEGLITYFNPRAAELWGRAPKLDDPVDRFCGSFRLFAPNGAPIDHENCWMAKTLRENRAFNGEEIIVERPDGSRLTALAHANPFHDDFGQLAGAVNALVDISERKRSEDLLASVVATQQEIATSELDLSAVMQMIAGRAERLTQAAGAVVEIADGDEMVYRAATGSAAASVGTRLRIDTSLSGLCVQTGQVLRCDDAEADSRVDREACRKVGVRSMVVVPLHHQRRVVGVLKVLSPSARAFGDADCRVLQLMSGLLAAALSRAAAFEAGQSLVAERTRALVETEERFRLLVDGVKDYAIIMTNLEGRIVTWNAGAQRLNGYSATEAIGLHISVFYSAEDIAARKPDREFATARAEGRWEDEGWRVRKDGTRFWANVVVTALTDAEGQLRGFAKVTRDMTERRRLEEQYRQAQKMEAIGQLAGGVAHDFNNLLTVISGFSELVLAGLAANDPNRGLIEEVYKAGERASLLTRQLLTFSRKEILAPKVLELNAVIEGTCKMLRRLIGEDIRLATAPATALDQVMADFGQLEQVLLNLAVNARDAMPTGGQLTIETLNVVLDEQYARTHAGVKPGRYVLLAVSDTGCGMTEEVKAKIFEPFFTTKGAGKGTGLGLATVFGIVQQSGGHVDVYTEVGQGTTFKIYLPSKGRTGLASASEVGTRALPSGNGTILIVEDDEQVRAMTQLALQTLGYQVLEARNGEEAARIGAAHASAIDLLITDVVMPGMSGRQVAEAIERLRPGIKVLYVSGYTDDAVVRHGILRSEAAFLQKPFTMLSLGHKVRDVLGVK